jgi:selenocysteine lyase/cysteine desulfurase
MPFTIDDLTGPGPNPLAEHYKRFRVSERILLTGHSHQAWPDVAREGQLEAWDDAAEWVDGKWDRAYEKADAVRRGFARLLGKGAAPEQIALGQNTHELVLRFLSALPLEKRPRLVTTDGEFHSIRRQLDRLRETGRVQVEKIAALPVSTLAERLAAAIDDRTAAVLVSSVLFTNAHIVPHLGELAAKCRARDVEILIDAYHQLNVVPCDLEAAGTTDAFYVGGGYKYCQLGEGNCFLRVPPGREELRPVLTGWFAEFEHISDKATGLVQYGDGPTRWAGSTYDPTSHYRAARVFQFFEEQGLTTELLREVSGRQVARLAKCFDALGLPTVVADRDGTVPLECVGGFLALRVPKAGEIAMRLRERGVFADSRGGTLRLGPAPYLDGRQFEAGLAELREVVDSA